MNKDNAKDYLPLVQALAEGKVIQKKACCGTWQDDDDPAFDANYPSSYRIKPEPRKVWLWWPPESHKFGRDACAVRSKAQAEEWLARYGGHITEVTE